MNKYKSLVLILFVIIVFSLSKVNAIINDYSLLGKIIYLDAGHGGFDSGAVYNNIYEKDINLQIVKKIEKELTSKGAFVYLTREGDYDLADTTSNRKRSDLGNRAILINKSKCDMFISIHLNATTNTKWRGLQIFYNKKNNKNKQIATSINNIIKEKISNVRDIKEENNYYMYKNITVPGVLIEVGFISNPSDNYILRDSSYQEKIARHITNGIISYYTS